VIRRGARALKNARGGIPNLSTLKTEPLNSPFTLKLWPSITQYLEKNGDSASFVREAILEKLQRILDQPTPARCSECVNLTKQDNEFFCIVLLAYLGEKKTLNQIFSCDYFAVKKGGKT